MWLTPGSTARRSTRTARSRSGFAVRRIDPKPIRLTVRSPSVQVPAAAAVVSWAGIRRTLANRCQRRLSGQDSAARNTSRLRSYQGTGSDRHAGEVAEHLPAAVVDAQEPGYAGKPTSDRCRS